MSGRQPEPTPPSDDFGLHLTRPRAPAPVDGQLAYESTVTAPTEWVPYVYTDTELRTLAGRRHRSVASLVCGLVGLLIAVFGVWGAPVSLAAIVLALLARTAEPAARTTRVYGLVSGIVGLAIGAGWVAYSTQIAPTLGY